MFVSNEFIIDPSLLNLLTNLKTTMNYLKIDYFVKLFVIILKWGCAMTLPLFLTVKHLIRRLETRETSTGLRPLTEK